MRFVLPCAILALAPSLAHAQEIQLTGPLAGASSPTPPSMEWSIFTGTGFATRSDENTRAVVALGTEVTAHAFQYDGPPAAGRRAELRAGPWGSFELRSVGVLGEGGITMHLGSVVIDPVLFRSLPFFDLRMGVGTADYGEVRASHLTVAIATGYALLERIDNINRRTKSNVLGSFFRLVTTYRRTIDRGGAEVGLALEITPATILSKL